MEFGEMQRGWGVGYPALRMVEEIVEYRIVSVGIDPQDHQVQP